jgi:F0F1-type ATP synthase assembly protein I
LPYGTLGQINEFCASHGINQPKSMENTPDQPEENRLPESDKRDPLKRATEKTRSFAEYSGIAFQMLGTIGAGVWVGMKIDDWQQTKSPIWTIILSLTAIGASLYLFIRQLTNK